MKDRISVDYMQAMRDKDTLKKNLLGVIKGEIQLEESRKSGAVDVVAIIKKMDKSLRTIDTEDSRKELKILEEYMPVMLTDEYTEQLMDEFLKENEGAKLPQVMAYFNNKYKTVVDNKVVIALAKQKLN